MYFEKSEHIKELYLGSRLETRVLEQEREEWPQ